MEAMTTPRPLTHLQHVSADQLLWPGSSVHEVLTHNLLSGTVLLLHLETQLPEETHRERKKGGEESNQDPSFEIFPFMEQYYVEDVTVVFLHLLVCQTINTIILLLTCMK